MTGREVERGRERGGEREGGREEGKEEGGREGMQQLDGETSDKLVPRWVTGQIGWGAFE